MQEIFFRLARMLLVSLILGTLISYLLVCSMLYYRQEEILFLPEVLPRHYVYPFEENFTELSWELEGATLNALHFKAERARGAILFLHGNGGSLRGWGQMAGTFLQRGYDVLFLDYRGYGKSTGRITSEALLLQDAAHAYDYLLEQYDEEEIILYGSSLGTGIATYLARSRQPRMLILESPYYSIKELAEREFPFIPSFLLKYPLRTDLWITEVRCPIYLFHGTGDDVIPYDASVRLAERITGKHELITIEGGGHSNLRHFARYQQHLDAILDQTP